MLEHKYEYINAAVHKSQVLVHLGNQIPYSGI